MGLAEWSGGEVEQQVVDEVQLVGRSSRLRKWEKVVVYCICNLLHYVGAMKTNGTYFPPPRCDIRVMRTNKNTRAKIVIIRMPIGLST